MKIIDKEDLEYGNHVYFSYKIFFYDVQATKSATSSEIGCGCGLKVNEPIPKDHCNCYTKFAVWNIWVIPLLVYSAIFTMAKYVQKCLWSIFVTLHPIKEMQFQSEIPNTSRVCSQLAPMSKKNAVAYTFFRKVNGNVFMDQYKALNKFEKLVLLDW